MHEIWLSSRSVRAPTAGGFDERFFSRQATTRLAETRNTAQVAQGNPPHPQTAARWLRQTQRRPKMPLCEGPTQLQDASRLHHGSLEHLEGGGAAAGSDALASEFALPGLFTKEYHAPAVCTRRTHVVCCSHVQTKTIKRFSQAHAYVR